MCPLCLLCLLVRRKTTNHKAPSSSFIIIHTQRRLYNCLHLNIATTNNGKPRTYKTNTTVWIARVKDTSEEGNCCYCLECVHILNKAVYSAKRANTKQNRYWITKFNSLREYSGSLKIRYSTKCQYYTLSHLAVLNKLPYFFFDMAYCIYN